MSRDSRETRAVGCAVAAFLLWGLFPLYWKQLASVPALEVVAHRTVWALVSLAVWVSLQKRWSDVRRAARPRSLAVLCASATLIALNWLLYIWAVANGHIVDASLGYYLNPLVNVLLGVAVLRERLSHGQAVAVGLAAIGVGVLTFSHGRLPWIALALAVTFGLYGLVRKTMEADALVGLLWETLLLAPMASAFLWLLDAHGTGAFGHPPAATSWLLALGGPITALPLLLFALGARGLPLSTLGFIQYLSPSLQFALGVFVYGEPFRAVHAFAFAFIWTALAVLSIELRRRLTRPGGSRP